MWMNREASETARSCDPAADECLRQVPGTTLAPARAMQKARLSSCGSMGIMYHHTKILSRYHNLGENLGGNQSLSNHVPECRPGWMDK